MAVRSASAYPWDRRGDLVIQVFFGARHIATLSSWQICWQEGNSGQLGFNTDTCYSNQVVSVLFYDNKEGPLQVFEAVPLYRQHYGKWRHMPPRDIERTPCRHPCWAENL
jgi:hypothetical protein